MNNTVVREIRGGKINPKSSFKNFGCTKYAGAQITRANTVFAVTIHIGGRSFVRNLWTCHAVVTGTRLTWVKPNSTYRNYLEIADLSPIGSAYRLSTQTAMGTNFPSIILVVANRGVVIDLHSSVTHRDLPNSTLRLDACYKIVIKIRVRDMPDYNRHLFFIHTG
jgi:hypothetical protein